MTAAIEPAKGIVTSRPCWHWIRCGCNPSCGHLNVYIWRLLLIGQIPWATAAPLCAFFYVLPGRNVIYLRRPLGGISL